MDGDKGCSSSGAEMGEEAMDVAVTTQQGALVVTPDGTSTLLTATIAQSQDTHMPSAAPAVAATGVCMSQVGSSAEGSRDSPTTQTECGDMEVSTTTTQQQNISDTSVTPSDPCKPVTSTEEKGDHQLSKATELHQSTVYKAEDQSEDSDSASDSSSSSTPPSVTGHLSGDEDDEGFSQPAPIRLRDEVLLEELPAVEEVNVMLPEEAELQPVGTVSSILQQLVVVQSLKDTPALTEESILFRSDRLALAKVYEVFGPVSSPLYILRFNSEEQIRSRGVTEGLTVYCAPALKEFTNYILVQQLRLMKGSDASWKNDQEPPPEALDFSDDEQEQDARRKLKNSRRKAAEETNDPDHVTQKPLQQQQRQQKHGRQPFRRNKHPQHHAAPPSTSPLPYPPPPVYLPPPPPFPHYPPPSFYNQPFSGPYWPPNSFPHLLLPPPPPPPPPPPQ